MRPNTTTTTLAFARRLTACRRRFIIGGGASRGGQIFPSGGGEERRRRRRRRKMSDATTAQATFGDSETNNRLTQYIVLRRDLWREKSWPLGSICAQVAHASVAALETFKDHEDTKTYVSAKRLQSMTKVVLEVKGEPQLLTLSKKLTENKIEHYAWREQPEDYVTCLALRPYRKEEVKGLLKKCNLASDVRQEEEDISVH